MQICLARRLTFDRYQSRGEMSFFAESDEIRTVVDLKIAMKKMPCYK